MEIRIDRDEDIDSWKEVTLIYNSALKQISTKLEILNDEFQHVHRYNPIEHIKSRIKTPESIVKKLKKHGYESTINNMIRYVNDIAGIRVICSFSSDIYQIAEMISNQEDIKVISVKDYIVNPKASGYKSYHMLVTVPVYLSDRIADTKVEIQIRTVAISGPVWSIKYTISSKAMRRSISKKSWWNVRRWCRSWTPGCWRLMKRYKILSGRHWKNIRMAIC